MTEHNPDTVLTAFYFTLETLLRRPLFDLDADTMLGLMATEADPAWEHGQYLACKHIANMRSIAVSHFPQRNALPEDTSPVSLEDFDAMTQVDDEEIQAWEDRANREIMPQSLRADLYACNPDESAGMREAYEETLHGLGDFDGGEGQ